MIKWETCQKDFRYDGSLRDIYVNDVSQADWEKAYALFLQQPEPHFSLDNFSQSPPASVNEVFACRAVHEQAPCLRFRVGRAIVVSHFFSSDEIECDLDPRDVESQADLDSLLNFISRLGDVVAKPVSITPENCPANPMITYDPWTKAFFYIESAY